MHSSDSCAYTDPNRKVDYLHGTHRVSFGQPWNGAPLTRQALYRFGTTAGSVKTLTAEPPVKILTGIRRLGLDHAVDEVRAGEVISSVRAGDLDVRVGF